MDLSSLIPIISAITTLIIIPLIIDWIKRRWDYSSNINKTKFEVLTELNNLLWDYHGVCSRVYGLVFPKIIANLTQEEIKEDIKSFKPKFLEASQALYNGLFSYKSKVHQYYDNWSRINSLLNKLIEWAFHDQSDAMDDHFLLLMQDQHRNNDLLKEAAVDDLIRFRSEADFILKLLATELKESNSFWYPVRRLVKRRNVEKLRPLTR